MPKARQLGFVGVGGGSVCARCVRGPGAVGYALGGGVTTDTNGGALLGGRSGLCAKLLVAEGWDTDTSWIGDRSICELLELLGPSGSGYVVGFAVPLVASETA